jgi:hypothetical protein
MDKDFQQELVKMESRMTELETKIDSIDGKLNQVVEALVGNPIIGNAAGLVSKISQLERDINDLRDFKKKIVWTSATIAGIAIIIDYLLRIYTGSGR